MVGKGREGRGGGGRPALLKGAVPAALTHPAPPRGAAGPRPVPVLPWGKGVPVAPLGVGPRWDAMGRGLLGSEFISLVISGKLLHSGSAVPLIEQAR